MKPIQTLISLSWLILCLYFGIGILINAPNQIRKDAIFIKNEINPNIAIIDTFKKSKGRLPTASEFTLIDHRANVDYIREERLVDNEIKSNVVGIDWSKNYVLWVWRGEWAEYYLSSSNKYITNNYSEIDGIIGLIICIIFGILPLSILLLSRQRKRKNFNL